MALDLIIFLRFSFVTNPSSSSRSAKADEGCLICRFATSCFTTSTTVKLGSIRTLTTPSLVVTLFVGIRDLFEEPLVVMARGRKPSPFRCEDMSGGNKKQRKRDVASHNVVDRVTLAYVH